MLLCKGEISLSLPKWMSGIKLTAHLSDGGIIGCSALSLSSSDSSADVLLGSPKVSLSWSCCSLIIPSWQDSEQPTSATLSPSIPDAPSLCVITDGFLNRIPDKGICISLRLVVLPSFLVILTARDKWYEFGVFVQDRLVQNEWNVDWVGVQEVHSITFFL